MQQFFKNGCINYIECNGSSKPLHIVYHYATVLQNPLHKLYLMQRFVIKPLLKKQPLRNPKFEPLHKVHSVVVYTKYPQEASDRDVIKQKILIFHILKNFPQVIKDKICEAIDLAIVKYLLGIDFDENFYLGDNKYVWDNYGN